MKILQCGYPKSGNYLLFSVIKKMLFSNNMWRSYKEQSGLGELIDSVFKDYKYHPEENSNDVIYEKNNTLYYRFPHSKIKYLSINPSIVVNHSSLIWTHSLPNILGNKYLKKINKRIYIVRDGRDAINSLMHFVTSPIALKRYPEYSITDTQLLYNDYDYFKKQVEQWKSHVVAFQELSSKYHLIRYEDMIRNKSRVIRKLGTYLNISVDEESISHATSFSKMKQNAHNHLRKGISGDWKNYYSKKHITLFNDIAGKQLEEIGYVAEDY